VQEHRLFHPQYSDHIARFFERDNDTLFWIWLDLRKMLTLFACCTRAASENMEKGSVPVIICAVDNPTCSPIWAVTSLLSPNNL